MGRPIRSIVFVEPSSTHLHVYSRVTIPRLGSVLLATIMRDLGYEVRVYIEDIAPVDMEEVFRADLVGISALTSTAPPSYHLARKLREAGIPTVLGGSHVTFLAEEALQYADYVIRGEGEKAFVELVEAIKKGEGLDKVRNLSYREGPKIIHNPERPKIAELDTTPIPDYSLIVGWKPGGIASIATSRGCPYPCSFCSVPGMYGRGFRTHSIERTLKELRIHRDASYIFFADDIFNANPRRMKTLLKEMIAHGLTPQWGAQIRTEAADDEELLELMRRSNCFNVYVGFESINPKTLKLYNKRQDLAKIERSIERFHAHGIRIHGMFVLGSDEDDLETVHATAEFAKRHDLSSVQFLILTPCPGSPDWEHLFDRGRRYIITSDWSLYDGHHAVHEPRRMSPYELQVSTYQAMKKFYSWGGILKKLIQRDFWTAGIRFYGRRIIKEWWRDERNQSYVERLRQKFYEAPERVKARCVALPESLLRDRRGVLLRRFLGELGLQVVAVSLQETSYGEALQRLRQKADCIILPVVSRARQGKEELYRQLEALQAYRDRLPQVIPFAFREDQGPVFESFAHVGFAFTRNLKRIRQAFQRALNALETQGAEGQTQP